MVRHERAGVGTAGLDVLDGVYNDFRDLPGFERECEQGKAMGFDGKTLIHPSQVEAANRYFGPTEDDVLWARKVIDGHAAAVAEGKGVIVVDGRLIENLHVVMAQRTVAMADAIAAMAAE